MAPLIEYLIKLFICLSSVSLFYHFILRKHTFYNWNRCYLLIYSALCFVVPFVDINPVIQQTALVEHVLTAPLPSLNQVMPENIMPARNLSIGSPFDPWPVVLTIIVSGILFMTGRFFMQGMAYLKIRNRARLISCEDSIAIYHVDSGVFPFSFGNSVFINPELHTSEELNKIILHEFIHVKQKHSIDNIWCEVLCILNWYNPFAWLLRYSIRQNLEYIADRKVLENGINPKQYQYLLLKVTGVPEFRIASQFNFSSLKQRIIMMNKVKTARIHLIRFLFVLPMLLILLFFFRTNIETLSAVAPFAPKWTPKITSAPAGKKRIFAGMVFDGATGKPIHNSPLDLFIGEKFVKKIKTDQDGFYFWEGENLTDAEGNLLSHALYSANTDYKDFGESGYRFDGNAITIKIAGVVFTGLKGTDTYVRSYSIKTKSFPATANHEDIKKEIQKQVKVFKRDYDLRAAFKQKFPYLIPENMITKFGNAYFDQKKELIGYEDETEFYLDAEKVTHQKISDCFKKTPVEAFYMERNASDDDEENITKFSYFTFPVSRASPPKELLSKQNIEWKNVSNTDLSRVEKEAYFLDGFRQTKGIGSNMKPVKEEIKKIALFKGDLARYYDKSRDKVWWIETRPQEEVFERPLF